MDDTVVVRLSVVEDDATSARVAMAVRVSEILDGDVDKCGVTQPEFDGLSWHASLVGPLAKVERVVDTLRQEQQISLQEAGTRVASSLH